MENLTTLFNEFNKMGIDAKRNAYSEEVIKCSLLIKSLLLMIGKDLVADPYNYKKDIDKDLSEEELLNINFKDIYYLKIELLMLLNNLNLKDGGDK